MAASAWYIGNIFVLPGCSFRNPPAQYVLTVIDWVLIHLAPAVRFVMIYAIPALPGGRP